MTNTGRRNIWCGTCRERIAASGDDLEIPEFLKQLPNKEDTELQLGSEASTRKFDLSFGNGQNGAGDLAADAGPELK